MTHYQVLGVPPAATQQQLHAAYKQLALQHHPDRGGDTTKFAEITAAYGVLKDAKRRRAYDATLKLRGGQCNWCNGTGVQYIQKGFTARQQVTCQPCRGTGQTCK